MVSEPSLDYRAEQFLCTGRLVPRAGGQQPSSAAILGLQRPLKEVALGRLLVPIAISCRVLSSSGFNVFPSSITSLCCYLLSLASCQLLPQWMVLLPFSLFSAHLSGPCISLSLPLPFRRSFSNEMPPLSHSLATGIWCPFPRSPGLALGRM